jgi:hypothetical protein
MNFSTWDRESGKKGRSPSITSAHVIAEFDRTKKAKIFAHKLGGISFERSRDLNADRQRVIDSQLGELGLDGFKYKNVGHVYDLDLITSKAFASSYSYTIYAHGHPLGGTEHGGMESCSRHGLVCKEGEGENNLCNPGRCAIGTLTRIRGAKWKYQSANTFGTDDIPLVYYVSGVDKVELRSVLRGNAETYTTSGPVRVGVDKPASAYKVVYLPPELYFSDDFIETALQRIDERLLDVANPPKSMVVGIEDRKNLFINKFIISVYPGTSEGYLNNVLGSIVTEDVRAGLTDLFSALDTVWRDNCSSIIEDEFLLRFVDNTSACVFK